MFLEAVLIKAQTVQLMWHRWARGNPRGSTGWGVQNGRSKFSSNVYFLLQFFAPCALGRPGGVRQEGAEMVKGVNPPANLWCGVDMKYFKYGNFENSSIEKGIKVRSNDPPEGISINVWISSLASFWIFPSYSGIQKCNSHVQTFQRQIMVTNLETTLFAPIRDLVTHLVANVIWC